MLVYRVNWQKNTILRSFKLLSFIVYILNQLISLYARIMLIYCLAGWFIRDPNNKFMQILASISEPPLVPIRELLHRFEFFRNSPVDFSPLVLFFILRALVGFLSQIPGWFS